MSRLLTHPIAVSSTVYNVRYHGYVGVEIKDGMSPSAKTVTNAVALLTTHKKQAREIHPLFACGLDTQLALNVCLAVVVLLHASFH